MDWRLAAVIAVCTGCPRTWGRGGTVDRAMAKDIQENLRQQKRCRQPCDPEVPGVCGPFNHCHRPSETEPWVCRPDY